MGLLWREDIFRGFWGEGIKGICRGMCGKVGGFWGELWGIVMVMVLFQSSMWKMSGWSYSTPHSRHGFGCGRGGLECVRFIYIFQLTYIYLIC